MTVVAEVLFTPTDWEVVEVGSALLDWDGAGEDAKLVVVNNEVWPLISDDEFDRSFSEVDGVPEVLAVISGSEFDCFSEEDCVLEFLALISGNEFDWSFSDVDGVLELLAIISGNEFDWSFTEVDDVLTEVVGAESELTLTFVTLDKDELGIYISIGLFVKMDGNCIFLKRARMYISWNTGFTNTAWVAGTFNPFWADDLLLPKVEFCSADK